MGNRDGYFRKAELSDLTELTEISRHTFQETFAPHNTQENMRIYMDEYLAANQLLRELDNPDSVFYFAGESNRPMGYVKINLSLAQTEMPAGRGLEIERIYVLKEFQGNKIGRLLLEKALSLAEEKELDFIWLGVWEKNDKAIAFYKKYGFVPFDSHPFRLGNDLQTDRHDEAELRS